MQGKKYDVQGVGYSILCEFMGGSIEFSRVVVHIDHGFKKRVSWRILKYRCGKEQAITMREFRYLMQANPGYHLYFEL